MAVFIVRSTDELKEKSMETLPRSISIASVFRWALHAAIDNQTDFEKAIRQDKKMLRVQEHMAERINKIFAKK